ncbi:hypothetical protein [Ruegeria arenilitoris]|uniref:hypothetical protein n=1 Tax=Ruegeria arenilitoris TaxID=1173585 RepID=UPI0020C4A23C|nr:hypothetical protein [Ruegeria arenilitoris]
MKLFMKTWAGGRLIALLLFAGVPFLMLASPAHAYIGPGAGLGAIAVTIAVVLGGIFLIVGLVWFPLKRLLRGRKGPADAGNETDPAQ